MLSRTYYAHFNAGIIGAPLAVSHAESCVYIKSTAVSFAEVHLISTRKCNGQCTLTVRNTTH